MPIEKVVGQFEHVDSALASERLSPAARVGPLRFQNVGSRVFGLKIHISLTPLCAFAIYHLAFTSRALLVSDCSSARGGCCAGRIWH
jgi:hypothetical protein